MVGGRRWPAVLNGLTGRRGVMSALSRSAGEAEGVAGTPSSHARFLYLAEPRSADWKLFGFDAIYMRDEPTPAVAGQMIAVDPKEVKQFRPSYRLIAGT
jgi:hypothetical protein